MSIDPHALPHVSYSVPGYLPFVWPLGRTTTPDEMNTSYGPRIDADRWDFHDGIDLPAAVGTPVYAVAGGRFIAPGPRTRRRPARGLAQRTSC